MKDLFLIDGGSIIYFWVENSNLLFSICLAKASIAKKAAPKVAKKVAKKVVAKKVVKKVAKKVVAKKVVKKVAAKAKAAPKKKWSSWSLPKIVNKFNRWQL